MAKCWKCGKEVNGFHAALVGLSTCPECKTLELLEKMEEEKRRKEEWDELFDIDYGDDEERPRRRRHRHVREEKIVFEPTDRLSPECLLDGKCPPDSLRRMQCHDVGKGWRDARCSRQTLEYSSKAFDKEGTG